MWASGRSGNCESTALSRTLVRSDSGQPPPKRFEPHRAQNVFALPSPGWEVRVGAAPRVMRTASVGALPFAVPTPPEIFLHVVQWQNESLLKGSLTTKATPPHWQLPCSGDMSWGWPVGRAVRGAA